MQHDCPETGCLYCMVIDLYEQIDGLKNDNYHLSIDNLRLKELMDKKIKEIEKKEKGALKETKELLKMDKKQDRKLDKCDQKMKKKK